MTEPEFFKIKSSLEYIRFYRQFEELFELVRYNVSEFWMYLVTISEYHRLNRVIEYDDFADPTLICNQRLANILTSFRTYLDHIAHKLSNRFGNQSHQYDIFKKKTSFLFENHFAYRFFYKLRNYLQHFGIPITKISYTTHYDPVLKKDIFNSVNIFIKKDDLIKYEHWGLVKKDLDKIKDEINIKNLLNEFYYTLIILYKELRSILSSDYENANQHIMNLYNECLIFSKEPINKYDIFPLYVSIVSHKSDGLYNNTILPIDMIKRLNKIYRKHFINERNILNSYTNMYD